jgi:hypothetical protein
MDAVPEEHMVTGYPQKVHEADRQRLNVLSLSMPAFPVSTFRGTSSVSNRFCSGEQEPRLHRSRVFETVNFNAVALRARSLPLSHRLFPYHLWQWYYRVCSSLASTGLY